MKQLLVLLALLLLFPVAADPCVPCPAQCPQSGGQPVCSPLNTLVAAGLGATVLDYGEQTDLTISAANQENITIECRYEYGPTLSSFQNITTGGALTQLGNHLVTAPSGLVSSQQYVSLNVQYYCFAQIVNSSADVVYCGQSCQVQNPVYSYPASLLQQVKVNAANAIDSAAAKVLTATSVLNQAIAALPAATAAGKDTAYATYQIAIATEALNNASTELEHARFAFDQNNYNESIPYSDASNTYAAAAQTAAFEAYASLAYTQYTYGYASYYINASYQNLNNLNQTINNLNQVFNQIGGSPLGSVIIDLNAALELLNQANKELANGNSSLAAELARKAAELLKRAREKLQKIVNGTMSWFLKMIVEQYTGLKSDFNIFALGLIKSYSQQGAREKEIVDAEARIREVAGSFERIEGYISDLRTSRDLLKTSIAARNAIAELTYARAEMAALAFSYRWVSFKSFSWVAIVTVIAAVIAGWLVWRDSKGEIKIPFITQEVPPELPEYKEIKGHFKLIKR